MLDLGWQPAADHFPFPDDARPDPRYALRMVLCSTCGLAQLEEDPTSAEEPRGIEPAAMIEQARHAVADLVDAGLARPGDTVAEFPSPHGGRWSQSLADRGLVVVDEGPSDLVVDSLGLMHAADQRVALEARLARLAPEGVLALHVHPLGTILRERTWNALRHGHFAYYSVTVLTQVAAEVGLVPLAIHEYSLYGGTVVVAFARAGAHTAAEFGTRADDIRRVLRLERDAGVTMPAVIARLGESVTRSAALLRAYLDSSSDLVVAGYGAASRAVALLHVAGVTPHDVIAVADASLSKRGRAIPGVRIPIVGPTELRVLHPDRVLLFVPDLLEEVRAALPEIEASGARWVVVEPEPREVDP